MSPMGDKIPGKEMFVNHWYTKFTRANFWNQLVPKSSQRKTLSTNGRQNAAREKQTNRGQVLCNYSPMG